MSVAHVIRTAFIALVSGVTAACTSAPSELDLSESVAFGSVQRAPELTNGILELLKQSQITLTEDLAVAATASKIATAPARMYRFVSRPVAVGSHAEARFEFYMPIEDVFAIAGRGVIVRPSEIERFVVRTGTTGFATALSAEEVVAFVSRTDLSTFCGTRTLMFEGTVQLGGKVVRGAVGAIHLLPRGGALQGGDCPFLTVGWEGWNPLPQLLCKRQDCTFTLGPIFGKRVTYSGKCTPTPMALTVCSCSPI